MEETIKLDKRLSEDLTNYCSQNGLIVEKYCMNAIRKQLALDKYGDLNEKVADKTKPGETPKREEPETKVKKDDVSLVVEETEKRPEIKDIQPVEEPKEQKQETGQPKVEEKKKHRTLKTK
jgi:hypothetical protein